MENNSSNPYSDIEKKWQNLWYKNNIYAAVDNDSTKEKKYILMEFPFPSGASLHMGHFFRYTIPDVYSRFLRMRGYNVLFPMGWDAFGLPTEEYARKTGINPKIVNKQNIDNFRDIFNGFGFGFDWNREFATTDPEYYKWTQWIFTELYKAGLAEQKEVELWWCEKLGTVLSNEEIIEINGQKVSERGEHPVEKKKMMQWILKMPEYAEELLAGLDETNFPEHIKDMQRNWIGKSEGVVVDWKIAPEHIIDATEFEKAKTTTVVLNKQNQVLVLKRSSSDSSPNVWELPGGGIDDFQDIFAEAKREVLEETGLEVENIELLYSHSFLHHSSNKEIGNVYFFTQANDEVKVSSEHSEYKWVNYAETLELLNWEDHKDVVKHVFQKCSKALLATEFSEKIKDLDKLNKVYGSCFLINSDQQVLIMKRSQEDDGAGLWDLAGGSIDKGEDIISGTQREVFEETGISVTNLNYTYSWGFTSPKGNVIRAFNFYAFTDKQPTLNWEHDEYKWVSFAEAKELLWNENTTKVMSKMTQNLYPSFAEKIGDIDFNISQGERGIAVIKIKETGQFVIYDKKVRGDLRVRFPGGHIDPGEDGLAAAIRETEEEVGLTGLEFKKYLGTSHGFYNWNPNKTGIIHKLDHFYYFECSLENWNQRKPGIEKDIECFLAGPEYIKEHATEQALWALGKIEDAEANTIQTFTTRVDTIYSTTFLVLAPEHPLVSKITTRAQKQIVEDYIEKTKNKSELDRQIDKEKTGAFTGGYVYHPLTGAKLPVWISDFVLPGYGTGAVMANAHDERDNEMAKKYDVPLKEVIAPEFGKAAENETFVEGICAVVFDPSTQKYGYLQKHEDDKFIMVGGGIKEGEEINKAAEREVIEETGLQEISEVIPLGGPVYAHYYNSLKKINRFALTYPFLVIADSNSEGETQLESHEAFNFGWETAEIILQKLNQENNPHQFEIFRRAINQAITLNLDTTNNIQTFSYKPVTGDGILYNSAEFNGLRSEEARGKIAQKLINLGRGNKQINYKFRDWVFSRQRYWGEPFPVEYIKKSL